MRRVISNLDYGVTDQDVKELFESCGPLVMAAISYDKR